MTEPSNLRDAAEVYLAAFDAWCGKRYDDCDVERAAAIIEADRAELVAEIVAWLNVRAGQVLQLHAEAKTDHERNIVDEHSSAIEQCAIEIEAKWGKK